jgi:peptidoglycan/xylan/chitin deacetylase (PgdA/CDA1 family)
LKTKHRNTISKTYYNLFEQFRNKPGDRVLLYHAVDTKLDQDAAGISVPFDLFEKQIALVNDFFKVIALSSKNYFENLSPQKLSVSICFDDGFKDNLTKAAPILLKYNIPFSVYVTTSFIKDNSSLYLTPLQLRELSALSGVTIGSHGVTHVHLANCNDATLWEELHGSKCYLEDLLGKTIDSISYPYGSVDRKVVENVKKAGYQMGSCSVPGVNNAESDPFLLYRTSVLASDSPELLEQKIKGSYDWCALREKIRSGGLAKKSCFFP